MPRVEAVRRRLAERLFDRELVEKSALIALVIVIFGRMLPGVDATPLETAVGVDRRSSSPTRPSPRRSSDRARPGQSAVRQFAVMLAINLPIVAVGPVHPDVADRPPRLEHALVFAGLLTLIVTLYDRYRPIHVARFRRPP